MKQLIVKTTPKVIFKFILRLLGGIYIDEIIIPKNYKEPRKEKLNNKQLFYIVNGYFENNIIIDENNRLIDGYTTYYIAKNIYNFKYIEVTRVRLKNK